jgi:hypothetical protein
MSELSDKIRNIKFAFSDLERKQSIENIASEVELLERRTLSVLGDAATTELCGAAIAFRDWILSEAGVKNIVDIPDEVYVPFSRAVDKYEAVSA